MPRSFRRCFPIPGVWSHIAIPIRLHIPRAPCVPRAGGTIPGTGSRALRNLCGDFVIFSLSHFLTLSLRHLVTFSPGHHISCFGGLVRYPALGCAVLRLDARRQLVIWSPDHLVRLPNGPLIPGTLLHSPALGISRSAEPVPDRGPRRWPV